MRRGRSTRGRVHRAGRAAGHRAGWPGSAPRPLRAVRRGRGRDAVARGCSARHRSRACGRDAADLSGSARVGLRSVTRPMPDDGERASDGAAAGVPTNAAVSDRRRLFTGHARVLRRAARVAELRASARPTALRARSAITTPASRAGVTQLAECLLPKSEPPQAPVPLVATPPFSPSYTLSLVGQFEASGPPCRGRPTPQR